MYDFELGNHLRTALQLILTTGRQTGKTQRVLERLQDIDVLIVPNRTIANALKGSLAAKGKTPTVLVVPVPKTAIAQALLEDPVLRNALENAKTFNSWVAFDNSWVNEFYKNALDNALEDFRSIHQCFNQQKGAQ